MFDKRDDLGRSTLGPTTAQALFGEFSKISSRCFSIRNQFIGIFITELIQRKPDGVSNAYRLGQQILRVYMRKHRKRT